MASRFVVVVGMDRARNLARLECGPPRRECHHESAEGEVRRWGNGGLVVEGWKGGATRRR
jgi:hypothetical protein